MEPRHRPGGARQAWFDAETFAFRSVKPPQSEDALDPVSRFQDRMQQFEVLIDTWMELYAEFLKVRTDRKAWPELRNRMRVWVRDRNAVH